MIQQKLTKTKTKMILITKTLVIFPLLSSSTSSSSSSLLILTSVSVYSVMCTAPLYPLQDFKALYKYRIITVARGRYSDSATATAEDCYILVVLLFFIIFSVHQIFDVPGPIFAKLCHATQYVLKQFISYMGVRTCPLTNLMGEKPHFLAFFGPKIATLSPAIPYCGENREI